MPSCSPNFRPSRGNSCAALSAIRISPPAPRIGICALRIEQAKTMAVILVADDEELVRTFASIVLQKAGHDVLAACDGSEAVTLYRSSSVRIDLVITDIAMPVMDGAQAVQLIRATPPGAGNPCMSGNSGKQWPPGLSFLKKPFTPYALCASVN